MKEIFYLLIFFIFFYCYKGKEVEKGIKKEEISGNICKPNCNLLNFTISSPKTILSLEIKKESLEINQQELLSYYHCLLLIFLSDQYDHIR